MILTLSERLTCQLVKELENLDPQTTLEEITERMPHYANRLFEQIKEYGVTFDGRCSVRGGIADFGFVLRENTLQDQRETILAGVKMLRPICISVEAEDLPALILNRPVLSAVQADWPQLAAGFQKISPSGLLDKIESAGGHVFQTRDVAANAPTSEEDFRNWCRANGLPIPGERRMDAEAAQEKANQARRERERQEWERRAAEQELPSGYTVREF